MKWANPLLTLTLLLAMSVLIGCSNSDDDDDAAPIPQIPPVQPSGNEDPEVNNFPFISIVWPPEFEITTSDLDINATGPQNFVFATVPLPGQAGNRIVCTANYALTNIATAEEAYNSYVAASSNVNILSIEDKTQDGRSGKEFNYDLVNSSNVSVSGLARAYYFNDDADRLTRSALFTLDCGSATSTFQTDRTVILQVQNSVAFAPRSRAAAIIEPGSTVYESTDLAGVSAPVADTAISLGSYSN